MKTIFVAIAACCGLMTQPTPGRVAQPLVRLALDDVVDAPASLSADGRYVAFESRAALVPADANNVGDIYVLDRVTGQLTLETVAFGGGSANGTSNNPRLSGDGRWLVFESGATNLVREIDGRRADIYLRDRLTGTTRAIGQPRHSREASSAGGGITISQDGRVVAFASTETQLVEGDDANGAKNDVYVMTLETGVVVRASVSSAGVQSAQGISFGPSLNADGTIVAFASTADFQANNAPALERPQIYVRDLVRGTTRLVSAAPDGRPANQISHSAQISADGRVVVFVSQASNLTPDDDNRLSDIYVRDLQTGTITLVSRTRRGKAGNGHSSRPALSADGQVVAFVSEASDLVCDRRCAPGEVDDNLLTDVYLANLRSGHMHRVSGSADHGWWTPSQAPAIDAAGTTIVFPSKEPIDPRDVHDDYDLFLWSRSRPPLSS
jgi:Tol biopolymer transport system component